MSMQNFILIISEIAQSMKIRIAYNSYESKNDIFQGLVRYTVIILNNLSNMKTE